MSERKAQREKPARRTKTAQRIGPRTSRSEVSRQRIIDAVITLIFRGQLRFGAVDVAKEAQIGLRTVFNHFDDMDSLYREMDAQVHQKVLLPIILRPFETTEWKDQVMEAAARRAEIFEAGFQAHKFARSMQAQSIALRESVERGLALERSAVEAIVPKDLEGRETLVLALDAVFGFEHWARLRDGSGLTAEEALGVLQHTTKALLQSHSCNHP